MEDPRVKEILRAMSAEQKLRAAEGLYWAARGLKAAALRHFHPDWSEEKIQQEVRLAFITARG